MDVQTNITFWIAFTAGLLSFFSPCVLAIIPSYITYISGITFDQLQKPHPAPKLRLTVFYHCLSFISGFSVVFIGLGVLLGVLSFGFQQYLQEGFGWLQKAGGLLIFLFGVHLSGLFHFSALLREKRLQIQQRPAGFGGTFLIGLSFAAGWTPCIGPILGSIFALVTGTSTDPLRGMVLLSAYSAGLGLPLLLSGVLFHYFLSFSSRVHKHLRILEVVAGVFLMVLGSLLFFDTFDDFTTYLSRQLMSLS